MKNGGARRLRIAIRGFGNAEPPDLLGFRPIPPDSSRLFRMRAHDVRTTTTEQVLHRTWCAVFAVVQVRRD